jgi:hypothetical protein
MSQVLVAASVSHLVGIEGGDNGLNNIDQFTHSLVFVRRYFIKYIPEELTDDS